MSLKLATDFEIPLDAVTQKIAFLAQSGAGKSYGAMKLAEEMLGQHAQVIALDPVGIWWGLRSSADGKKAGLPIAVFGGEHGDLPLPSDSGALVADILVDEGIPAVLDLSDFELPEMKRFVTVFAERFFQRKKRARSPVHLFLEEAQTFAPQNPESDETTMLSRVERLARIGRNYGVGWSVISQRPQDVHKKVLNQAGTLIALRTIGRHERKAITDWVADKARTESEVKMLDGLPSLETGVARVWSPSFLKVAREIHIARRSTFDSSATPEIGASVVEPRTLARVDVARLRTAIESATVKAKANDPAELKKRISELERENRELKAHPPTAVRIQPEYVDVPVLVAEDAKALSESAQETYKAGAALAEIAARMMLAANRIKDELVMVEKLGSNVVPPRPATTGKSLPIVAVAVSTAEGRPIEPTGVSASQQKVLDALASLAVVGLTQPQRAVVAAMSGYTLSGNFQNLLSQLKTAGAITYPTGGAVSLTESGRRLAKRTTAITSLKDLHDAWMQLLAEPQRRVLAIVMANYPKSITREELARMAGYSLSGNYQNILSSLHSKMLVTYPERGQVAASELLFPEGLA